MKDWQKHGKNIQSIGNSYFNTVEIFCCADKNSFVDWLIREEEDPSNIAAALKTRLLVAGHLDDHHMRIHVISKKLDEDKDCKEIKQHDELEVDATENTPEKYISTLKKLGYNVDMDWYNSQKK